ncbi:MAG: hypothetical protein ABEL97_02585 [Salinibacter sp.]
MREFLREKDMALQASEAASIPVRRPLGFARVVRPGLRMGGR